MKVLIKGAGDLASAVALRLYRAGCQILMTDIPEPTTVRRTVSFSPAVYEKEVFVEDVRGMLVSDVEAAEAAIRSGAVAIIVDPGAACLPIWQPDVLVDAILAKKNLGTTIDQAPLVIGLGPGFHPGKDCHCAIETARGHYLGRVLYDRAPAENTGVPGLIGGYGRERIIRTGEAGRIHPLVAIGDCVKRGDKVAEVVNERGIFPVLALIDGVVRGMLQEGAAVFRGMKAGDIDPRGEPAHCMTVSDKGSAIGGGVLEAICAHYYKKEH
ncbi:MAG: selenium-dependent molybdenum cofactor biosynthesis protein YqeB [Eubacteriales bacterium]|nr:selenium-dependent molybdenum cofactor biosynthesis protein YqeB [Eubacteriales bacterium]